MLKINGGFTPLHKVQTLGIAKLLIDKDANSFILTLPAR